MGENKVKVKVYKGLDIIFSVQFKKIEILIRHDSYVFLGNIKSNKIEISKRIKSMLLRKFKIFNNCINIILIIFFKFLWEITTTFEHRITY